MGAVHKQLSVEERRRIERWRHAKVPVDEMARVLGRCRSTIFRELKRNHFPDPCLPKCDGYYGAAAQLMAADRRARPRKPIRHTNSRDRVIDRLIEGWTPEHIAGRLGYDGQPAHVRHETICAYVSSREGQSEQLAHHLPSRRNDP